MDYKAMSKDELLSLLSLVRASIELDDSFEGSIAFEGSIEYLMPEPLGLEGDFAVRATLRVGNSMGQGSVILIPAR